MKDKNDPKKSMMDNDIEDLFDENVERTGTLVKTIKKARRKTILRNIFISVVVSCLLMLGFLSVLPVIKQNQEDKAMTESNVSNSTFLNPNVYSTGAQTVSNGLFSGIISFEQYKIINGKPVDWGERKIEYTLTREGGSLGGDHSSIQLEQGENRRSFDRYTKQRIMEYYHPEIKYKLMTNDFPLLEMMPETAAAELAISFTDKLSPQQVRDLIPKGVSLEWYWIDSNDKLEYEDYPITANGFDFYGFEHRKDVLSEEFFINWLKEISNQESDGYHHKEIKQVYKELKGANKEIKTDQIKILGAVVSGTPKNLLRIRDISQVRTGVLGAVTTTY